MEKYLCIHGHFYQPPRENPWLEHVEQQDSAHPFHDWNERIAEQCYEPNAAARILNRQGFIKDIVNNYSRISFNFGPTLLSWLETHEPETYEAILDADRQSQNLFSGHGSAIAQAYNHLIMPLANDRDKKTQILWGLRDFSRRFGRAPEGMWLPETAVDMETLQLMAEAGIKYTILAPHQAARVKPLTEERWCELEGNGIDPKAAYLCRLPGGNSINLFFYDGPIAQEVAFSELLKRGESLAERLAGTFSEKAVPQLVHIATDGETYGHHHLFGEMALAYCLRHAEENGLATLTVYGEYLERHPPTHEVEIVENSSWSCAHGIERWRSDCGCYTGGESGWNQKWRKPLREALDWLRDKLAVFYEKEAAKYLKDPWESRDAYIEVILDRSPSHVDSWLENHACCALTPAQKVRVLSLLEMQRQALLMYTSCGWFFNDISGIETVQILGYASRAIQLAEEMSRLSLEEEFIDRLRAAPSNLNSCQDGARVYEKSVRPMRVDLARVAAHHAMISQFRHPEEKEIYCYTAQKLVFSEYRAGKMRLSLGQSRIRSEITRKEGSFVFAVLYLGSHNQVAGVGSLGEEKEFTVFEAEMAAAFQKSNIPETLRLMERHFPGGEFSLEHLFHEDRRLILQSILSETLTDIESSFQDIHDEHYALMRFLHAIDTPIPSQLALPVGFVLNGNLRKILNQEPFPAASFRQLVKEIETLGLALDRTQLEYAAEKRITEQMGRLAADPENLVLLGLADDLIAGILIPPLKVDLWKAQNHCFSIQKAWIKKMKHREETGDKESTEWLSRFKSLADNLKVS